MPRSFPTIEHVQRAAYSHGFREMRQGETEDQYRAAVADHVQSRDLVESMEIRTGKGWNAFSEIENLQMILGAFAQGRKERPE